MRPAWEEWHWEPFHPYAAPQIGENGGLQSPYFSSFLISADEQCSAGSITCQNLASDVLGLESQLSLLTPQPTA